MSTRFVALLSVLASIGYQCSEAAVVTFQQGDGGSYSSTDATYIRGDVNMSTNVSGTNFGTALELRVDETDLGRTLIRFPDVFGSDVGQVPIGSNIVSATLSLVIDANNNTNPSLDTFALHNVIVDWDENVVSWDSFGSTGGGASGTDYEPVAVDMETGVEVGINSFDVTASIQQWSNGAANRGWVLLSDGGDGALFQSDDVATLGNRPLLSINVAAIPEPSPCVLFLIAMVQLRWRRCR